MHKVHRSSHVVLAAVTVVLAAGAWALAQQAVQFRPLTGAVIWQEGQQASASLCMPAVSIPTDLCGGGPQRVNPTGGTPPYHFQLDTMGGFPPMGVTLLLNGLLIGTPRAAGDFPFRVCAVDLSGSASCQLITITVLPRPAPGPPGDPVPPPRVQGAPPVAPPATPPAPVAPPAPPRPQVACEQLPQVQSEYIDVMNQIEVDRQFLRNLGSTFDQTTRELESFAETLANEQREGQFDTEVVGILLESASEALQNAAEQISVADAQTILDKLGQAGVSPAALRRAFPNMPTVAAIAGVRNAALVTFNRLEVINIIGDLLEVAQGDSALEAGVDGVILLVKGVNPPLGFALGMGKSVGVLVGQVISRTIIQARIAHLAALNERQLETVKLRSQILRGHVDQLVSIKRRLKSLADCSRLPQPTANQSVIPDAPKQGGGGVATAAKLLVGAAALGGGAALAQRAGLFGEGAGGGSCYTTKSCIINQLSGTCSCGSATEVCSAGGASAGQSCSAGPCAKGLNCVNGRCEAPGRCQ